MSESEPEYLRYFPYSDLYENQREAMDRIYGSLARGEDVLFEGACGTGKTLAALAPALEYADATDRTVVITTNVHQQMRQFVTEARAIREAEPIRAVVFRGKASMCHIDVDYEECQILRDNTRDLVEAESDRAQLERRQRQLLAESQDGSSEATEARSAVMDELDAVESRLDDLRERATCDHYYGNLTTDPADFKRWLYSGVRTPDDVYDWAGERGACGYERLKEAMAGVDLVVCNYHHLLDPDIRNQFFRWLDCDPSEVITVFDEAHNIESTARDHATRTLSERTLSGALDECREVEDPRAGTAANVLEPFHDALVATYDDAFGFGEREAVGENWEDVPVDNDVGRDDLTRAFLDRYTGQGFEADLAAALELGADLEERYERAYREGKTDTRRECPTREAAAFVEAYLADGAETGQYPIVAVRRDAGTGEVYGRAELYACIPREVTRSLLGDVHASVLMSATLRPFDVTADVLGMDDPATMAFRLSFPEENRRTFAVDAPPLFASARDDPEVQAVVSGALSDAIEFTPGNTLVFFPSYAEAERYAGSLDREVYLDEPASPVQDLKESFVADSDAALFTSLWGTLTEGVSFDGDDARSVAVVGVPYPHLDDRAEAVQDAYDAAFDDPDAGWEYAVEVPTIRKTRQALGRALRSPAEVGTRILIDQRYTAADMGEYSVRETFPEEERAELIDVNPAKLKFAMLNFYGDHDAWEGDPPAP
ncbi:MAG: ATP-dependent DNA helicase [Halobacteriales archaeon]